MNENFDWIKEMEQGFFQINEENPHYYHDTLKQYLSFYQYKLGRQDEYRCSYETVNDKKTFYQFFLKKSASITIYLVHGYLDHSGGLSRTVNYLLQQNYHVVMLDLPGHGFSEGEEGMIASFDDYLVAIQRGYELIVQHIKQTKVIGMGHSTGGALLFHATTAKKVELMGLVLVAPLYFPYKWNWFKRLLLISGKVISNKKRIYKRNSSDKNYREFVKRDPLQVKTLKAKWLHALELWQKEFVHCRIATIPVYILQGTKDRTVEWKKNLLFYKSKSSEFQVALFEAARHQLLNERKEVRTLVQKRISSFLLRLDDV